MDFSAVTLTDTQQKFRDEVRLVILVFSIVFIGDCETNIATIWSIEVDNL